MKRKRPQPTVEPNYPDTAKGAIAYLASDSTHDMTKAEAIADPQVEGVWKVMLPNDTEWEYAIVYLQGYREPLGRLRDCDDFESIYRD
jgi:hypothetical protein